ncbi:MAG: DUF116 domain-containing protein [FCB group bacterium]|nr:DUF116 domain-containing protein [FCB group bacterium]
MEQKTEDNRRPDRKLGDEWADWNGRVEDISADTDARVFIGLAMGAIVVVLGLTALFGWLIYPRLSQMGHIYGSVFNGLYFTMAAILFVWLALFIWGAVTKRPFLSTFIIVPKLVNLLLELTLRIGRLIGIAPDKMFNSFLKLHNLIISSDPKHVQPAKMLVVLPRCLTKEMNSALRKMRDHYGFNMAMAGGGGEARRKIRELRPGLIIAVACERDLLTGFVEVNPHIPVIGFPNIRPCGPCKNTEVDLQEIESTIKHHLIPGTA